MLGTQAVKGKPRFPLWRSLGWFHELGLKEPRAKVFADSFYAPLSDEIRNALVALFDMRWPNRYACPKCQHEKYWITDKKLIHCMNCGHQASPTANTIFHGTRKPLLLWFHIIWWVVAQKTGASAYNLKDFMGFGSYETAWSWLHKLRRAMVRSDRER